MERRESVQLAATGQDVDGAVHVAANCLAAAEGDLVAGAGRKVVADVPGSAGIRGRNVPVVPIAESAGTAQRRTAVCQSVPPGVRRNELQAMRETLLQLRRHRVVIAKTEARRTRDAAQFFNGPKIGAVDAVSSPEVSEGVKVGLQKLMGLMVALVSDFERHLPGQLLLHCEVPLLHHGIAKVLRNRAEL